MTDPLRAETERLLALADAATSGPWTYAKRADDDINPGSIGRDAGLRLVVAMRPRYASDWENRDGAFIAAAPNMAAHIRALQAENDRLQAECDALRTGAHIMAMRLLQQPDLSLDDSEHAAIDAAVTRGTGT